MNNNAANAANAATNNTNYNYEEYDYNNMNNLSIGDDLLNNRINNVLGTASLLNTNLDFNNIPTSATSTINPSNNFLLYYYVEYM